MNRHLKEFLRKATAIVAMAAVLGAPQLAWATPIVEWNLTGVSSPATATATTANANLQGTPTLTRGSNAAASSASNSFRTQGFKNEGIATTNTDYFEFTMTAAAGYSLSVSAIDASMAGTASFSASPGATNQFAYSLDGTSFTLIGSPLTRIGTGALPTTNTSEITALQNVGAGQTVTFRFFASGQTTTGGWGFNSPNPTTSGLSVAGLLTAAGGGDSGANYYWVGSDTTLGGAGTWASTGGTSWRETDTDGTGVAWDSTKTATFGGASAGTVTVTDTVTTNAGLSFATAGYTLTGGTLTLGADSAAANLFDVAGGSTTVSSILAGSNGLTKTGAGSLVLSGTNSLTGGIAVSSGAIVIGGASALGSNAVTLNGGTLSSDATARSISNAVTFTGNGGLATDDSGNLNLTGPVSFASGNRTVTIGSNATVTLSGSYGTGGVTKAGAGTLVLGNTASLTGLGVSAGTLRIAEEVEVTTTSQPSIAGGTLAVDGSLRSTATTTSGSSSGALAVGATGVVIQQGNGSPANLLFTGNNTWEPGSTFVFRDFTSTPSVSNRTYAMNVVFESTGAAMNVGAISGSNPWTVEGDLTIGENVNFNYGTYTGTLTYSGNVIVGGVLGATNAARSFTIGSGKELRLENGGTLNIASGQAVTISGGVRSTASADQTATISGGSLSLGNGNRTFDVAAGTANAGLSISSVIESGSLSKTGAGRLTLSGVNTYSGGTTVSAGTLSVAADAALGGSAGGITLGGGTLEMTSGFTLGSGRTITAAASTTSTLAVTTGTVSYGGAFTGSGDLDKIGAGQLTVSNASSGYTGLFTISAGTLEVTGANAFANATLSQTGGTLLLAPAGGGDVTIPDLDGSGGTTEVGAGVTAVVGGSGDSAYNGQIRGQGALKKEGNGVLTLNGNNDFAGNTRISQGRLKLGANGALSATPLIEIDSGAIFDVADKTGGFALGSGQRLGGRGTILGNLEFGAGSQIAFDPTGPMLVGDGAISFAAGFGIGSIDGLGSNVGEGTYTLLNETTGGSISFANLANVGAGNAFDLGGGKSAYFQSGSLQVVVVPEPDAFLLGGLGLAFAAWASRRRERLAAA